MRCTHRHTRFSQAQGSGYSRWQCSRLPRKLQAQAEPNERSEAESPVQYATQFGYNRKDVLIVGVGLLVLGYAAYYGLQSAGIEAGQAGNFVQLGVFVILSFGWTASYLFRVINKDMTYSKQLKQYEEAVMQKRLEEMPETERSRLYEEVEAERARSK